MPCLQKKAATPALTCPHRLKQDHSVNPLRLKARRLLRAAFILATAIAQAARSAVFASVPPHSQATCRVSCASCAVSSSAGVSLVYAAPSGRHQLPECTRIRFADAYEFLFRTAKQKLAASTTRTRFKPSTFAQMLSVQPHACFIVHSTIMCCVCTSACPRCR